MRSRSRLVGLGLAFVLALVVTAVPAAGTSSRPDRDDSSSSRLRLLGETGENRPVETFLEAFFTDLAFQGDYAYQGTWNGGFRTVDISKPRRPKPAAEIDCGTFQGDIGVYGDLVFRSIDTPVEATTPEETCDAPLAASGFEGIQIFEVKNPRRADADDLVTAVATDCGSHTHTVVPDLNNNRVLIYNSTSQANTIAPSAFGNQCTPTHNRFDIV